MYALSLASDGRIHHVTDEKYVTNIKVDEETTVPLLDGYVLVDVLPVVLPDDPEATYEVTPETDMHNYRYVDGVYIYDPIPVAVTEPTTDEIVNALLGV